MTGFRGTGGWYDPTSLKELLPMLIIDFHVNLRTCPTAVNSPTHHEKGPGVGPFWQTNSSLATVPPPHALV